MRTPAPKLGAIKRTSKGKVRTMKVTWGNDCSIFLDNPQGCVFSHQGKNQLERTMSVQQTTIPCVESVTSILTELMIIKAIFFLG